MEVASANFNPNTNFAQPIEPQWPHLWYICEVKMFRWIKTDISSGVPVGFSELEKGLRSFSFKFRAKWIHEQTMVNSMFNHKSELNQTWNQRMCELFVFPGHSDHAALCQQAGQKGFLRQVWPFPCLLPEQWGWDVSVWFHKGRVCWTL